MKKLDMKITTYTLVLGLLLVGCQKKNGDSPGPKVGNGETYTGIVKPIPGQKSKSLAVQNDGKILTGTQQSTGGSAASVFRFNLDLTADEDFGTAGKLVSMAADQVFAQSGNKVVTSGYLPCGGTSCLTLQRYDAHGTLDTTFGTAGSTTTAVQQYNSIYVGGLPFQQLHTQTQADGKFVVGGAASSVINPSSVVQRYSVDGALDTTFAAAGNFITTTTSAEFLAILPDGRIRVGDGWDSYNKVVGLTPGGLIDSAFGSFGALNLYGGGMPAYYSAMVGQSDGKIVLVGGLIGQGPLVVRYNVDGSADTAFGTAGRSIVPIDAVSTVSYLALQPDGKIIVGSTVAIDTNGLGVQSGLRKLGIGLSRLNFDGTLDTTFGDGGTLKYDLQEGYDQNLRSITFYGNDIILTADALPLNSIGTTQATQAVLLARLVRNE